MDDLLRYETEVQTFLQEDSSAGVLSFPVGLESESPEAQLWSRVHLSYAISLKLSGRSIAPAIEQWAGTRTGLLLEYAPRKTWFLSQAELKELQQKLILRMESCWQCFQRSDRSEIITPLTLFCCAFICFASKDKELFDENLLPTEVSWSEFVSNTYSPIWTAGIEFVCTKVTNGNLLPTALHILSKVNLIHEHFLKLSTNQVVQKDYLSWLYEIQQLKTISSCCEDAISSYFDGIVKLQLCEDLNQMLSSDKVSSVTQQGFYYIYSIIIQLLL